MPDEIWEARRNKLQKELTTAAVNLLEHVRAPALMARIEWPANADPLMDDIYFAVGDLSTIAAMVAAAESPTNGTNDNVAGALK